MCVLDIPNGAVFKFTFADRAVTGTVFHNYGGSIMLKTSDGLIMINAQSADTIEAVGEESQKLWMDRVAFNRKDFTEFIEGTKVPPATL